MLAVLNSPLMWWHNWRYLSHMKDEALNPAGYKMEVLPSAEPEDRVRDRVESAVDDLLRLEAQQRGAVDALLDWLRVEHEIAKPGRALESPFELTSDRFVDEVRRRPGKKGLSAAGLQRVREEYAATVEPVRRKLVESAELKRRLSDLVNEAYGLTDEEVDLMWKTAPPRMPVAPPKG